MYFRPNCSIRLKDCKPLNIIVLQHQIVKHSVQTKSETVLQYLGYTFFRNNYFKLLLFLFLILLYQSLINQGLYLILAEIIAMSSKYVTNSILWENHFIEHTLKWNCRKTLKLLSPYASKPARVINANVPESKSNSASSVVHFSIHIAKSLFYNMRYRLGRLLLRPSSQSLFFSRRTLLRVLHSPSCKAECSDYTPRGFL